MMKASEFRQTLVELDLCVDDAAALLSTTPRSVYRWQDGTYEVPELVERLLRFLKVRPELVDVFIGVSAKA